MRDPAAELHAHVTALQPVAVTDAGIVAAFEAAAAAPVDPVQHQLAELERRMAALESLHGA